MVQDPAVGREVLLNRARELVPVLRERAPEAERLRRMPNETVKMSHGGGGGFGPPYNRDKNQIEIDLKNGLISHDTARKIYQFE